MSHHHIPKKKPCSRFHLLNNRPPGGTPQGSVLSPPAVQNPSNNKRWTTHGSGKKKRKPRKRKKRAENTLSLAWLLATNPELRSTDSVVLLDSGVGCGGRRLWICSTLCCSANSPQDALYSLPTHLRSHGRCERLDRSPRSGKRFSPCKMLLLLRLLCATAGHSLQLTPHLWQPFLLWVALALPPLPLHEMLPTRRARLYCASVITFATSRVAVNWSIWEKKCDKWC